MNEDTRGEREPWSIHDSGIFQPASAGLVPRYAALTHPGYVRKRNEDQFAIIRHNSRADVIASSLPGRPPSPAADDAYFFVVADGLGGAAFGNVASASTLRMIWELGIRESSWPVRSDDRDIEMLRARATRYVQSIHEALWEHAERQPEYFGMGTTLTAAYAVGHRCLLTHVGDSRAYRVREGKIRQITRDHTLAERLRKEGMAPHPDGGHERILTNCLGGNPVPPKAEFHVLTIEAGDVLLLCTDGLTDVVSAVELLEIVSRGRDPRSACVDLRDLALERGGPDNVTVIVILFE